MLHAGTVILRGAQAVGERAISRGEALFVDTVAAVDRVVALERGELGVEIEVGLVSEPVAHEDALGHHALRARLDMQQHGHPHRIVGLAKIDVGLRLRVAVVGIEAPPRAGSSGAT